MSRAEERKEETLGNGMRGFISVFMTGVHGAKLCGNKAHKRTGWCFDNSNNVDSRTISTALYTIYAALPYYGYPSTLNSVSMAIQDGHVSMVRIYRGDDKPFYHWGSKMLICVNVVRASLD